MRLSKRSVQLVGIVVMVGLAGGFALASINAPGSSNQTQVSNGTTNTNFQQTGWGTGQPTYTNSIPAGAVCAPGLSGVPCATGDQAEVFAYTYTGACVSNSGVDTFTVTDVVTAGGTNGGGAPTYTGCAAFSLYVDFGAVSNVVTVTSIDITVSGAN